MPFAEIAAAVSEVAKEAAKEIAKEVNSALQMLDKPLSISEVGEFGEMGSDRFKRSLAELDKPLNEEKDAGRALTNEEKMYYQEKLGWSDDKFNKCTIRETLDGENILQLKTDRCDLEGKTAENGVPYERKIVDINGVKVEGVFPKFESVFDTALDADNYKTKAYAKECNAKLGEAIQGDEKLRGQFSPEQLADIKEGRTPTGYTWHHNEEPGKMQLVRREDHDKTIGGAAHTGGNSLWGADSIARKKEGASFS